MKIARYGTPSGNIFIAGSLSNPNFTAGYSKDEAVQRLTNRERVTYSDFPPHYEPFSGKSPLLIVGSNNFIRERMPFFILQKFDVHLMFFPTSERSYRIGAAVFSKTNPEQKPILLHAGEYSTENAFRQLILGIAVQSQAEPILIQPKLILWYTHWIYRCPKISLRDIQSLEPITSQAQTPSEYIP